LSLRGMGGILTLRWGAGIGFLLAAMTAAAQGVPTNLSYRVQVRELRVRAEPRPMSEVVTTLTYRTEVSVTATNGGWYRIGGCGWVHTSGITRSPLEAPAGTVEDFSAVVDGVLGYLTNGAVRVREQPRGGTAPPTGCGARQEGGAR
jgi:hypothetical protein